MAKKTNAKVVPLLSPENYIKQKARTLPIHECWINEAWDKRKMANILVARRHTNGHFTVGMYLVDLLCLGVKDAFYQFNISVYEYNSLLRERLLAEPDKKVDYQLVHNIIFEAIEFADLYDFQPHKDFTSVAQYILEDDEDDGIELMDIECGMDGKPFYMRGPGESDARAKQIIAQLRSIAGDDGFAYADRHEDDNWQAGDDFEDEEDDDYDEEFDEDDDDFDGYLPFDEMDIEPIERDAEVVAKSQTFEFMVRLKGVSEPEIWRKLTIPSYYTFFEMHSILQIAFGWDMSHLFEFSERRLGKKRIITDTSEVDISESYTTEELLDAGKTMLSDVIDNVQQKLVYLYDFGDYWEHEMVLERIIPEISRLPVLVDGKGSCPPEDVGGAPGYAEFKNIMANKKHPEHKEYREWLGLGRGQQWECDDFHAGIRNEFLQQIYARLMKD